MRKMVFLAALAVFAPGEGAFAAPSASPALPPFHAIAVRGAAMVLVKAAPRRRLRIVRGARFVTARVASGRLRITTAPFHAGPLPVVEVSAPVIDAVDSVGASDVRVDGLRGGTLFVSQAGPGDVVARGREWNVEATLQGNGTMDLSGLRARTASVRLDGSGEIRVDAADSLVALIEGSGVVRYRGKPPRMRTAIDGAGAVRSSGR
jgi:hypothetical protein